jgi:hypothetical protein
MQFKPIQQLLQEALKLPSEKDQQFCRYKYIEAIYEKYVKHLIEADYRYEIIYIQDRYRPYETLVKPPVRKSEFILINKCKYPKRIDMESGFVIDLQSSELEYMGSLCARLQQYVRDLKDLMYHPSVYKDKKRLYDLIKKENQLIKQYYRYYVINGVLHKRYYTLEKVEGKWKEIESV